MTDSEGKPVNSIFGIPVYICIKAPRGNPYILPARVILCPWCGNPIKNHNEKGESHE